MDSKQKFSPRFDSKNKLKIYYENINFPTSKSSNVLYGCISDEYESQNVSY